ncbi:MAG: hypothetical protein G5663_01990 [Serratia symbiotica]|nr:hypothetical protein [Serratia symbiotica]
METATQHIVSTSVTITGSLLAIDAPVAQCQAVVSVRSQHRSPLAAANPELIIIASTGEDLGNITGHDKGSQQAKDRFKLLVNQMKQAISVLTPVR